MTDKSIFYLMGLILFASFLSCTSVPKETTDTDSVVVAKEEAVPADTLVRFSKPDPALAKGDTLFNQLARQKLLQGDFIGVTIMTESFVDINSSGSQRKLMAALIQTGEGTYSGAREGQNFETVHAVLAVFESKSEGYSLLTHANLEDGGGQGLRLYTTEGETISLAPGQEGVMIHNKSSESGAGDYGFRKDEISIYVLLNNVVTSVLQTTLEDFQFSSDEQTSMSEQTITTELTVLDNVSKGLFDIRLHTTVARSGTEEPAEEGEENTESKEEDKPDESEPADRVELYKWNGGRYEQVPT